MTVEYVHEFWVVKHLYEECRGLFKNSVQVFNKCLRKQSERIPK